MKLEKDLKYTTQQRHGMVSLWWKQLQRREAGQQRRS